jgi:hypothetical protein
MKSEEHCVTVVVDPEFGIRLLELMSEESIWIVDSPANTPIVQTIWKEKESETTAELTSFKVDKNGNPEDWLISELTTIDLHHGEYSHDPAWSVLNAIGISWSDRIARELAEFGFSRHAETPLGFIAKRKLTNPSSHTTA